MLEVVDASVGEHEPVLSPRTEGDQGREPTDEPARPDGVFAVEGRVVDVVGHAGVW